MAFVSILAIIASIVLTVLICIKVLPENKNGTFSKKPLQVMHDYFNFKKLYLETVLKIVFTYATILCIVGGLSVGLLGSGLQLIFDIVKAIINGYGMSSWVFSQFFASLLGGIGIAVLGPIALRLVYELVLMFILLVKNVIEINNKMKISKKDEQ